MLIIKREYLTRVRKKTFIISTILFPLLYLLLIFGTSYIAKKTSKELRVALIDSSGLFDRGLVNRANLEDSSSTLEYFTGNTDSVINNFSEMGYDGYIIIPPTNWETGLPEVTLKADKTHGITSIYGIQNKLNSIWNNIKYPPVSVNAGKDHWH